MRLLVDTQALLWWFGDHESLGAPARRAIADPRNQTFVSALSLAEIAIKQSIGKLRAPFVSEELIAEQGMIALDLTARHSQRLLQLPMHHRDPFDRLLIAQAMEEGLTIVTSDTAFGPYDVAVFAA